jgi:hypothetical protein
VNFSVFKAAQERPYIPGIMDNPVPGTVLRNIQALPAGVEGIALDRSRIDTVGIMAVVTADSIKFDVGNAKDWLETGIWEYRIHGDAVWSDIPKFGSLTPNREYAVLIRKREDANHFASEPVAILIRTLAVGPKEIVDPAPEPPTVHPPITGKSANDGYMVLMKSNVVSRSVEFSISAPAGSVVDVAIFDKLGNAVFKKSGVRGGEEITWGLLTRSGRLAADGSYLIAAVSRDKNGKVQRQKAMFRISK